MKDSTNEPIVLPTSLLKQATVLAKKEGRTRQSFIHDAVRRYIIRTEFIDLIKYGKQRSSTLRRKPSDVSKLVKEYRREANKSLR